MSSENFPSLGLVAPGPLGMNFKAGTSSLACINFFPSNYVFQDLKIRPIIGGGRETNGLYIYIEDMQG